eukprot:4143373-Alexandrium_andersonii.AAC.1
MCIRDRAYAAYAAYAASRARMSVLAFILELFRSVCLQGRGGCGLPFTLGFNEVAIGGLNFRNQVCQDQVLARGPRERHMTHSATGSVVKAQAGRAPGATIRLETSEA